MGDAGSPRRDPERAGDWPQHTQCIRGGAVFGPLQTAQRGEVTDLAHTHTLTISGRKTILTDSRYVHDTVKKLQRGHPIAGAHRDLWTLIQPYIE